MDMQMFVDKINKAYYKYHLTYSNMFKKINIVFH